jgi:hypothetical protein
MKENSMPKQRPYKGMSKKLMSNRKKSALKLWVRLANKRFKPKKENQPSIKIPVGMEYKK